MECKILTETMSPKIRDYLINNKASIYISDELEKQLKYYSNAEFRYLLFQKVFACIGCLDDGGIVDMALYGVPAQGYYYSYYQLIALSSWNPYFLSQVDKTLKIMTSEDDIKKVIVYINSEKYLNKLIKTGFNEDYRFPVHSGGRIRLSKSIAGDHNEHLYSGNR